MDHRILGAAIGAAVVSLSVASVAYADPDALHGRDWALRHLGPSGLEKCSAFRKVREHTAQLQASGGGTITVAQRQSLEAELTSAKHMSPKRLTPFQCGVPL
jgi:hypothetical protein